MGLERFRYLKVNEPKYVNTSIITFENGIGSRASTYVEGCGLINLNGISANNQDYVTNPRYAFIK